MKKYAILLLPLLFTATAHAANTYSRATEILHLDTLGIAAKGAPFGLVQYANVDIKIPQAAILQIKQNAYFNGRVPWLDEVTGRISVPNLSIDNQPSQTTAVEAVLAAGRYQYLARTNTGGYVVGGRCLNTNFADQSKTNRIVKGMTYQQVTTILGCIAKDGGTKFGIITKIFTSTETPYRINVVLDREDFRTAVVLDVQK